jgi:hypothetical protein
MIPANVAAESVAAEGCIGWESTCIRARGNEFAVRQAPVNWDIVSCRACLRARAVNVKWKCASNAMLWVFRPPLMARASPFSFVR